MWDSVGIRYGIHNVGIWNPEINNMGIQDS
jgi:hypothetical protein